jgi:protein involved in polysaccharide export with SLBB domain
MLPIDATCKVRVANLRTINAAGMSYLQLKSRVENLISANYPLAGVQFVLANPAVFRVFINGDVDVAQQVNAWALVPLSQVLKGHLTDTSSIRDVDIRSRSGAVHSYDIFKALRLGDASEDPFLRPDDTITVHSAGCTITVQGEVERPGRYQLLNGEGLKELIEEYGEGWTLQADRDDISLSRSPKSGTGERQGITVRLGERDVKADYPLKDGDRIVVGSLEDREPTFFVEGAIRAQGTLNTGTGVSTMGQVVPNSAGLSQAQTVTSAEVQGAVILPVSFEAGLTVGNFVLHNRNAFTGPNADLGASYVLRNGERLPINLYEIMYVALDPAKDIRIENKDTLVVPFKQLFVTVSGAVKMPGRFPYIPDRSWEYYIALAGGFTEENSLSAVKITDMNNKPLSKKSFIPPEAIINARRSSFVYQFNRMAPIITTLLTIASTILSIEIVIHNN